MVQSCTAGSGRRTTPGSTCWSAGPGPNNSVLSTRTSPKPGSRLSSARRLPTCWLCSVRRPHRSSSWMGRRNRRKPTPTGNRRATPTVSQSRNPVATPIWNSTTMRTQNTMNVDITALRAVEKEKGIEFDSLIETLETALLTAYRHTSGHQSHARVEVDRKSGAIRVLAAELDEHGEAGPEFDDTPDDFG